MNSQTSNKRPPRVIQVLIVTAAATVAWWVLAATLTTRTQFARSQMREEVRQVWGPGLAQPHLEMRAGSFSEGSRAEIVLPSSTKVEVNLHYEPKKRGLLWHRTYDADFHAEYEINNPGSISRNIVVRFKLPEGKTSYDNFQFTTGESTPHEVMPHEGMIETSVFAEAGQKTRLIVGYTARGMDRWSYVFPQGCRLKDFSLTMKTDFDDINIPANATSPTHRTPEGKGWNLEWNYKDVIDARDIAMDMPTVLHAGPVLARIAFFAPISLVLFFAVLVISGILRGQHLHPFSYAFIAAGFFSFHLLLAYLGDLMSLHASFAIAATVSSALVCSYIYAAAGRAMLRVAAVAQTAYMVLFSYSFFFDGFTGLTLTITGIATLALLMNATAKVNWEEVMPADTWFRWKKTTPGPEAAHALT